MAASDIDVVFADGAGTPDGDLAEARALTHAFGGRAQEVPVTVPKSMVGRLYAGGASLDVATALLAMRDGVIPPTVNVSELAEGCELNLVREAQTGRADHRAPPRPGLRRVQCRARAAQRSQPRRLIRERSGNHARAGPLYGLLDRGADGGRSRPAISWNDHTLTYAQLRAASEALAEHLRARPCWRR